MNKKIIRACQAAVVLLVCLALCSCTLFNTLTAYSLYSKAFSELEKAGGYEADCQMSVKLEVLGQDLSTDTQMRYKKNGENLQSVMEVESVKITSTKIGDTIYVDNGTTGIKYSLPEQEDGSENTFGSADIPVLAKDVFENIEVVKNEDGTKTVTIALDNETAMKYLGDVFDGEESVALNNIVFDMIFNKKNDLQGMKISCSFEAEEMGVALSGDVSADYTFVNFGEVPEITLGLDESKYKDGGEYEG